MKEKPIRGAQSRTGRTPAAAAVACIFMVVWRAAAPVEREGAREEEGREEKRKIANNFGCGGRQRFMSDGDGQPPAISFVIKKKNINK